MKVFARWCALLALIALLQAPFAHGHDQNSVQFTEEGGYRIIRANGIPNHPHGKFPNRGNPNSISAQNYIFRVPLDPKPSSRPTASGRLLFGIALNGVPFDPGTAEFWNDDPRSGWRYDALSGKINLGIDQSNAHVQPSGAYHYHGLPLGLISKLGGGERMLMIGWAADGFPIYSQYAFDAANDSKSGVRKMRSSYRLKKGARPGGPRGRYDGTFNEDWEYVSGSGDLDECNGRFGVTPEFPNGTYYYCITETYPFISRSFRGTPDSSFRHQGGGPPGGRGGPGGRGPPGRGGGRRPPPQDDGDAMIEELMLGR